MELWVRIWNWGDVCFGSTINTNKQERSYRFLEEALELVQAVGTSKEDAHKMVDYVYGRPVGSLTQEIGGVGITLHLLVWALRQDLNYLTEVELQRCWERIDKIRAKQLAKPIRVNTEA